MNDARFWAKVAKSETCWLWTGSAAPDGYGRVKLGGRKVRAHRVSLALSKGVAAASLGLVMHSCDTPLCVRPDHLREGTNAENMRDMTRKGRRGSLTNGQVVEIRARHAGGERLIALAEEYRCSYQVLQQLVARKSYRRAEEDAAAFEGLR